MHCTIIIIIIEYLYEIKKRINLSYQNQDRHRCYCLKIYFMNVRMNQFHEIKKLLLSVFNHNLH